MHDLRTRAAGDAERDTASGSFDHREITVLDVIRHLWARPAITGTAAGTRAGVDVCYPCDGTARSRGHRILDIERDGRLSREPIHAGSRTLHAAAATTGDGVHVGAGHAFGILHRAIRQGACDVIELALQGTRPYIADGAWPDVGCKVERGQSGGATVCIDLRLRRRGGHRDRGCITSECQGSAGAHRLARPAIARRAAARNAISAAAPVQIHRRADAHLIGIGKNGEHKRRDNRGGGCSGAAARTRTAGQRVTDRSDDLHRHGLRSLLRLRSSPTIAAATTGSGAGPFSSAPVQANATTRGGLR